MTVGSGSDHDVYKLWFRPSSCRVYLSQSRVFKNNSDCLGQLQSPKNREPPTADAIAQESSTWYCFEDATDGRQEHEPVNRVKNRAFTPPSRKDATGGSGRTRVLAGSRLETKAKKIGSGVGQALQKSNLVAILPVRKTPQQLELPQQQLLEGH